MIIYTDILTGDAVLSDSYDVKVVDGIIYEADCATIKGKEGGESDIDGDPSAEEGGESPDSETLIKKFVESFRLQQTSFDKKNYLLYLKGYIKDVKVQLSKNKASPDEIEAFEKGISSFVKNRLAGSGFQNFEFYIGESQSPDGLVVLLSFRDDGITPYVTVWKHGVKEKKS